MRCRNCGWENPESKIVCEKCNSPLESTTQNQSADNVQLAEVQQPQSAMKSTVRESSVFGGMQYNNVPQQEQPSAGAVCRTCGYPISEGMQMCPACGTPVVSAAQMQNAQFAGGQQDAQVPNPQQAAGLQQAYGMGQQPMPNNNFARQQDRKLCRKCGNPLPQGVSFCPTCGNPVRKMSGTVSSWDSPSMMQGDYGFCTLKPIAWARENRDYQPITYSGNEIVLNRANTDPNNQTITSQQQAVLTRENDGWYIEDLSASHSTMVRVGRKFKLQSGDVICMGNRLFEFNE